jgi:hypothetical protein
VKIWTKRAAGVGAIIGGLLVAGSVAANAADLPLVSSLPLVGSLTGGQQQAAPAVPQPAVTRQRSENARSNRANHEGRASQTAAVVPQADGYQGGGNGSNRVVIGNASGTRTLVGTGNTNVNAPINVCGNPINGPLGVSATADCDNKQDNLSAGSTNFGEGDENSVIVGTGSGTETQALLGNTNIHAPINTCGNPVNAGGLFADAACKNRQRNVSVGHAGS